jgi:cyclase
MRRHLEHPGRRAFLQALAGAMGTMPLALPRTTFSQAAQAGPVVPVTKTLGDRVTLITGAGNNVIALAGDSGSLLVDAGDAAHAAVLKDVLKLAGNVTTVFNTHYHLESTGGNDAMANAGAKIVAHVNTKLWMTQEIIRDWEGGKVYPPRAKAALPTETFRATSGAMLGEMTFGNERIEYGLLTQSHTDGDLFLHFKNANVLAVGDAVQPGRLPTLDWFCGGWIGGMQNAQKALLDRADDHTKIVPAAGPVMTKADLQANHATIVKIREKLVGLLKKGQGAQNMIDARAVDEFKDVMPGDAATFLYCAYRGLWAHARELGGIV